MAPFPLAGYRVINFGWVIAAPLMGHLLADFGAEVIRVESNTHLDTFRNSTPEMPATSAWLNHNLSTLGITANWSEPKAIELTKRLVAKSDVVIENFPPRVLKSRGLDYRSLRQVKPDLIMISASSAGQTGPLRDIMTYGPTLSCLAGMVAHIGYPDDGQICFDYAYPDPVAAVTGAFLILACLRHRNLTGEGQHIDMAQSEATTGLLGESIMEYTMNRRVMGFQGNHSRWMAPHNLYPCKGDDRWVSIAVKTGEEWESFCRAIGSPSWTRDGRFADRFSRLQNRKELDRLVSEWTVNYTHYEVMEILQKAGVAAIPSLDNEERFVTDPQNKARETFVDVKHPDFKQPLPHSNVPWRLSETPGKIQRHAPKLGQHNDYVYGEILGLSKEEIAHLTEEKVLY